jgi:hypothetical protein
MTDAQYRGYHLLLMHLWESPDCALPAEDQILAKLSLLGDAWGTDAGKPVRACLVSHPEKPGFVTHERLLDEWRAAWADWKKQHKRRAAKVAEKTGTTIATVEPPVMEFPTCDGKTWPLTASKLAEWQSTYQTIDVMRELIKARQWSIDNGLKTLRGMTVYLGKWLSRANDRGGSPDLFSNGRMEQTAAAARRSLERHRDG